MIKDRRDLCASGIIKGWDPKKRKRCLGSHRIAISDIGEDKSFADDLNTKRGIVSSRVALLLRSAEIKPLFYRFVLMNISSPSGRVCCGSVMNETSTLFWYRFAFEIF